MLIKEELKKKRKGFIKIEVDDSGRISSANELILQNLLVSTNCDLELISKLTLLPISTILSIYIKYSQYIDKLIINSKSTNKDNDAIEKCLDMLIQHIDEIYRAQQKSGNKYIKDKELSSLLKILDRLVAIRNTKVTEFDKLAGSLVILTTKVKTLEKIESGELKLNTDSNYNFDTISDKLNALIDKTTKLEGNDTKSKPVYVVNAKDNTVFKYPSISSLMGSGISASTLYKWINSDEPYKDKLYYDEEAFSKKYPDRVQETNSTDSLDKK